MDENLEIPDTNNRDANFEKLIGEIITNAEPVGPPASKKRKVETKKVVIQKPKEVKEDSEEPEAREAINRILNDAKSLMRQQQQEQEEMIKSRLQDQKNRQNFQTQKLRQQRNAEKPAKAAESKPVANDSGSQSAPVIPNNQKASSNFITNIPQSQPLNRTMSNPSTQATKTITNQQKPTVTISSPSSNLQYAKINSTTSPNTKDTKPIIKNSLPLPQGPGVYILARGQQLIKQPSHVQAEIMAKDMKQKQEEKNAQNLTSPSAGSITPQKPSSRSYVVTHHDLPKNMPVKNEMVRFL
uniref:Uncharacterized protein n=1 Tax=Panagrolaimus superbus TaxID=310955 RepID=A0A914YY63_9BILA